MDIPVLIDVLARRGILYALPVPLTALVIMLALLFLVGFRPSTLTRLGYDIGATASATVFAVSLLRVDESLSGDTTFVLNRPAVALVLLTPIIMRPTMGLLWSVLGLGLSLTSLMLAFAITGVPFNPGWGPFTAWAVYAAAYIVLSLVRRSQQTTIPDLGKLEGETRRMALESQFEQRAAAMIHDTVLGDLTAVMNSTGTLDDRARDRFRADVATLKNPTWLRESDETIEVDERDAALRNGTVALVSEMQWRGLTVDITGTNDSVVRLSSEATTAVHEALRACFENVLAHSGTKTAELVSGGTAEELTYMVIDHGMGFEPSAVPADRLGLRNSVVARIEGLGGSVRVWSQPGSGTSVLISMPPGADDV
jgi:signal transduction histidine kinase